MWWFSPERFASMVKMEDEGQISRRIAKDVLAEMIDKGLDAGEIVKKKELVQISDRAQLEAVVEEVLRENQKSAADYKSGKTKAMSFLVGQAMKKTKGKANPQLINEMLKKKLE